MSKKTTTPSSNTLTVVPKKEPEVTALTVAAKTGDSTATETSSTGNPNGGTPSNIEFADAADVLRDIITQTANEKPKQFRVTLMKDTMLVQPELWLDVWIEGDKYEQSAFSNWLIKAKCHKAVSPELSDLVVFTGGTDVDPALYGAERMSETEHPDVKRDKREVELYEMCVQNGIPMLGICRGAQFLAVMNGAKLYQHVDNHNRAHDIFDIRRKVVITNASSVHHQMVIADPKGGMEVIADTCQARNRFLSEGVNRPGSHMDVEAFFYRDTVSLGIQGHPEYAGYPQFSQWCLELIQELVLQNPDIALTQIADDSKMKYQRVKEELLFERKHLLKARNNPLDIDAVKPFKQEEWDLVTSTGAIILGHGCKTKDEYDAYAKAHHCKVEPMSLGGVFIPSGAHLAETHNAVA